MPTTDRVIGDYQLTTRNGDIYFTANAGTGRIVINGNLFVIGTTSNVESVNSYFYDNFITLSANVVGAPLLDAGIEVKRGSEPTVSFRWNESLDRWQVTSDGSFFSNLMIRLEDDADPHLGGHLYTTGSYFGNTNFEIRSLDNNNIVLTPGFNNTQANTGIQITHTASAVLPVVANATVIMSGPARAGDTGLYVARPNQRSEEFITKRRALIYALVL